MMHTFASDLYAHMRATSSHLQGASDKALLANLKRFIVDESEKQVPAGEGFCPTSPEKSSPGNKASTFSPPKKPKALDSRPAILARKSWTISINRLRGTVTIGSESIAIFYLQQLFFLFYLNFKF